MKSGDGYELHFCTVKREKNMNVHLWYRWFLNKDFLKTLRDFGRLPLEMSVDKLMYNMKERDDFK